MASKKDKIPFKPFQKFPPKNPQKAVEVWAGYLPCFYLEARHLLVCERLSPSQRIDPNITHQFWLVCHEELSGKEILVYKAQYDCQILYEIGADKMAAMLATGWASYVKNTTKREAHRVKEYCYEWSEILNRITERICRNHIKRIEQEFDSGKRKVEISWFNPKGGSADGQTLILDAFLKWVADAILGFFERARIEKNPEKDYIETIDSDSGTLSRVRYSQRERELCSWILKPKYRQDITLAFSCWHLRPLAGNSDPVHRNSREETHAFVLTKCAIFPSGRVTHMKILYRYQVCLESAYGRVDGDRLATNIATGLAKRLLWERYDDPNLWKNWRDYIQEQRRLFL